MTGAARALADGAVLFVTLPDLVLPRTTAGVCTTAGAEGAVLRGRDALAFGFAVVALVVVLAVDFVVLLFFGAAFTSVDLFDEVFAVPVFEAVFGADFVVAAGVTLGAGFVASRLANFTGPEGPLGRENTPFFSPAFSALLR